MGGGIALTALLADLPVVLYDVSPEMLAQASSYISSQLEKKRKAINFKYLTLTGDLDSLARCNFVIEAVPEELDLKSALFAQLDRICPPPAILATNTSTLSVTAIAAATSTPERVGGMHFFNPAPVLPLVEVIRGARSSAATIEALVELAKRLGKTPVVARDTPGFIANRVARPFYGEALRLLGEGAAPHEEIDRIVRSGGFRMGPFELMDLIGIDVNFTATRSVFEQTFYEPRYRPHPIQAQMVAQKALGRKTGRGFYDYSDPNPGTRRRQPFTSAAKAPGSSQDDAAGAPPVDLLHTRVTSGKWGAALAARLPAVEEAFPHSSVDQTGMILMTCGKDERLRERLTSLEEELGPEVPILCQCVDVTLGEVSSWMRNPERVVGFDSLFFPQPPRGDSQADQGPEPVLTLVAIPRTSPAARAAAERFSAGLGCEPVWIDDAPALVLPRIVACLANEAAFAEGEGVADPDTIDLAMRLGMNYPKGPLAWAREIGYAQICSILAHLQSEYGEDRYRPAPLLRRWARLA